MIVDVPADTGVSTPVAVVIVATLAVLLDHDPPVALGVSVVFKPIHELEEPYMATDSEATVTRVTRVQLPPPNEYVIYELPVDTPVIKPVLLFTVTFAGTLLLHTPPDSGSLNVIV